MKDIPSSQTSYTINCGGELVSFDIPKVMGIINVTPDSFYMPESRKAVQQEKVEIDKVLTQVNKMVEEGVDIIDIGGVSTRPGADLLDYEKEYQRVIPVIEAVTQHFPDLIISIDTFRAAIAEQAIMKGGHIINDVSGGQLDDQMFELVADLQVPYIMMHMQGTPETMQDQPTYDDVTQDVMDYFLERVERLNKKGVKDIIVDPGFGFGKTVRHNYQLLKNLDYFKNLDIPLLAGISRKSMINKVLNTRPEEALNGTTVLHTLALMNGADMIRVHDVEPARQVIKLVDYYYHLV